jgi:hypothetical protein
MDRNVITVEVTPEDFAKAPQGYHNGAWMGMPSSEGGCVLHHAIRRLYPESHVHVTAFHASIGDANFQIDRSQWGGREDEISPTGMSINEINRLSAKAKESLEGIPTFSVILTP